MSRIQSIAFDLDDTLLDTSNVLIPQAALRACEVLMAAGLKCTLQECLDLRKELAVSHSHTHVFKMIADRYGIQDRARGVEGALQEFYHPKIPPKLILMPGAQENLEILSGKYFLYLVTMGAEAAQQEKIRALGIASYFRKIFIRNSLIGERKESAFKEIIAGGQHEASALLSVGNRLSSEIRDGKKVGARTCYFAHGEHVGEKPTQPEDHPDFTITSHPELIAKCGL